MKQSLNFVNYCLWLGVVPLACTSPQLNWGVLLTYSQQAFLEAVISYLGLAIAHFGISDHSPFANPFAVSLPMSKTDAASGLCQ